MNIYAHAVYCDDIRQEVGGKQTLVGVYNGSLLAQSFPVTLPKLCLALHVVLPAGMASEGFKVLVLRDEDVLAEGDLPGNELREGLAGFAADEKDDPGDADKRLMVGVQFIFSPLHLEGPGMIRIRVQVGDEEIKANALRIGKMEVRANPE